MRKWISIITACLFCATCTAAETDRYASNRVLFLIQTGNLPDALKLYRNHTDKLGHHDYQLLQQIGMLLLEQGYHSSDPEAQLLSVFGAGISTNEKVLHILEDSLSNKTPQIQLVGLHFLAKYQNDTADLALRKALNSPFLLMRLETVYILAEKKHPIAYAQAESLMLKCEGELQMVFPELYAMIGDRNAMKMLRKFLSHQELAVRLATILSAAKYGRDDVAPQIRVMLKQRDYAQQEACATALGMLQDEAAVSRLQELSESPSNTVRLASLLSLYKLGEKDARLGIEALANNKDLFAIAALAQVDEAQDTLIALLKADSVNVRINAALALLELRDERCLPGLMEILFQDSRDLAFVKYGSNGGSLTAWRAIPSATQNLAEEPMALEQSIAMRAAVLAKALNLADSQFMILANALFERQENDLIPALTELLETLATPEAIQVLRQHQQKAGAPLIRNYCNLALYRLKEEGPFSKNLQEWITTQSHLPIMQVKNVLPSEIRDKSNPYELTSQETTKLLLESLEAFILAQDDKGVDVLLDAIENGNPNNKYALAGLLIFSAH